MRYYETAFLITPDLSEEDTEKLISQMGEIVKKNKGRMIDVDKWGKRKLAYPIKKHDSAFYVFFYYGGIPETYAELERQFKQKETIIRYLTLRKEEEFSLGEETKKKTKKEKPEKAEKQEAEKPPEKKESKSVSKEKTEKDKAPEEPEKGDKS
ncbi:MAG TPA: 30S ribosomal protein S6 [Acidobacteriota bacterium]|nr:30S ribosomal protein S6 [Acidobacteriota bacterium]